MSIENLVEAVSAAIGAAAIVVGATHKLWASREARQEAAFRRAVQQIVDASVADVINRQIDFEVRQGRHLDRQDTAIAELRKRIDILGRRRDH